ncbi:MAG: AsnC family transcriptional regulator [Rubrivivax sp.]
MTPIFDVIDQRLLNQWQRGFPLRREPYAVLAEALGLDEAAVLARLQRLHTAGAFSRVGGAWAPGAGGAALLCAYAVPAERLDAVAAQVSAQPGVNHNYQREHRHNLWFVLTGPDAAAVARTLDRLNAQTGLRALRLPMLRAYRIDLGFDLRQRLAADHAPQRGRAAPVDAADRPLAAWLEDGLPLQPRPYDEATAACGWPVDRVLATLQRWLDQGTLRRLGVIVRHHELGFDHNAMAVFDVADDAVDAIGERLAQQSGVTLAYRRARAPGWRYNLYAMVHGRARDEVRAAVAAAAQAAGLDGAPHELLFSCRRFKQQGGRYFSSAAPAETAHA